MNSYTFHITLYDLVLFGTLTAGLIFALLVGFAKRVGRKANLFLGLALVVIVLKTGGLTPLFLPALGPLLYFYVRQSTHPDRRFRRKDMLHFCPLLVVYWMPGWLILISVIAYLYLSHRLIQDFYRRLRPVLMDRPRFAFRRLNRVLLLLGLCCALAEFNDIFYFTVALVLIGMAADAILKPDNGVQQIMPITDRSDAREKSRRLKEAVAANRLYDDAELTLTTLAVKLNIHPHDLSRIINVGLEKNFSDFINEFRVREVARKMQDPAYDRLTLLGIAYESGFNSKRTFNRVFKEMTGKTPVEYKHSLRKEGPIDKLAPLPQIHPVILRSGSLQNWAPQKLNRNFMFRNYLKIAWRNLLKNSVSSFINISGLTIGMAVALLIGLWIYDELSFNKYHKNYDRIAQVNYYAQQEGEQHIQSRQSYLLADVLKRSYGNDFKQVVMAVEPDEYILSADGKNISRNGQFMEPGGPELLTLNMLAGTRPGLKDPHSIFLSSSTAKALFGNKTPTGQIVKINNELIVKVTGVYEDLPRNSKFYNVQFFSPFDLYVSYNPRVKEKGWQNLSVYIYVQLQPNLSFRQTTSVIKDVLLNKIKKIDGMKENVAQHPQLFLHPMKHWHLQGDFKEGVPDTETARLVWTIGIIGCFVLLLACINFINLATARSEKRAKEVGIRKTMGAERRQLVRQFLSESFLAVIFAFILALILAAVLLPWFNELANKEITIPWSDSYFWIVSTGFIMLTSLLAGFYPAFYLSSFQPVRALKNTFGIGTMAVVPRKILVMLQFTVSIILIISTIIIFRQTEHAENRPAGYNGNGLLMIRKKTDEFKGKFELLRTELKNTGVVNEVAESNSAVTGAEMSNGGLEWRGKDPASNNNFATLSVTRQYGNTVGWRFIAGRNFLQEPASDSASIVINEAAAKYMRLKNPVNEIVRWDPKWRKPETFRIIGVIRDMVMESPFGETQPALFFLYDYNKWINIRLKPNINPHYALPRIETEFKKLLPNTPFDYQFADQEYAAKFDAIDRMEKLASLFALLAISISCLGLFGLVSFVAEQRTKEIGIRKIVGATIFSLWKLLSKDFLILVVISCVVAIPIAYYFMHRWLQGYQYRINLSWWVFAIASISALVITLITVSIQTIKTAFANPVKSLRTE